VLTQSLGHLTSADHVVAWVFDAPYVATLHMFRLL